MKKKGLIISSIVMVVVLIASLTTATYAWFSASNVTSLEDFNVTITANNAVNIGFDKDSAIATTYGALSPSNFVTGAVTVGVPAPGDLAGSWSGVDGLSASIEHNIQWGAQSKAVAAEHSASALGDDPSTDAGNYESIGSVLAKNVAGTPSGYANYRIVAANSDNNTTLVSPAKAYANLGTALTEGNNNGDFVYFVLGVQPNGTEALDCNHLCIALDWGSQTGATLGVLASLHVAYRVTKQTGASAITTGTWQDVDIMGESYHINTNAKTGVTSNITNGTLGSQPQYATAYQQTYSSAPDTKTTYMYAITDLSTTIGYIDQIELIIYLDGTDGDCLTSGTTNIAGAVKMFFCTDFGTAE